MVPYGPYPIISLSHGEFPPLLVFTPADSSLSVAVRRCFHRRVNRRFGHYVREALPNSMRVLDMQDFHALRLGF